MSKESVQGIVEVMGTDEHEQRAESLGEALRNLSRMRTGIYDDAVVMVAPPLDGADMPGAELTRKLFSFRSRAKRASGLLDESMDQHAD